MTPATRAHPPGLSLPWDEPTGVIQRHPGPRVASQRLGAPTSHTCHLIGCVCVWGGGSVASQITTRPTRYPIPAAACTHHFEGNWGPFMRLPSTRGVSRREPPPAPFVFQLTGTKACPLPPIPAGPTTLATPVVLSGDGRGFAAPPLSLAGRNGLTADYGVVLY